MRKMILATLIGLCLLGSSQGQKASGWQSDRQDRPERTCPEKVEREKSPVDRERQLERTCPERREPVEKPVRDKTERDGERASPTKNGGHLVY